MPAEVKIYECEVKKLFKKDGINEWRWVVRPVKDAILKRAVFLEKQKQQDKEILVISSASV
jgi:hypothetical protein